MTRSRFLFIALGLALLGCWGRSRVSASLVTVRGNVVPGTPVRLHSSETDVVVTGPLAPMIGRLNGAEVLATGFPGAAGELRVRDFQVAAVNRVAAFDGVLAAGSDSSLAIVTRDRVAHPITNPPAELRAHVGQRLWITGPLATGAVTFGVIDATPASTP